MAEGCLVFITKIKYHSPVSFNTVKYLREVSELTNMGGGGVSN